MSYYNNTQNKKEPSTGSKILRHSGKSLLKKGFKKAIKKKGLSKAVSIGVKVASAKLKGIAGIVLLVIFAVFILSSIIGTTFSNTKSYINIFSTLSEELENESFDINSFVGKIDKSATLNSQNLDANIDSETFENILTQLSEQLNSLAKNNPATFNEILEKLDKSIYSNEILGIDDTPLPFTYKGIQNFLNLEKSSYAYSDPRYPDNPSSGFFSYKSDLVNATYTKSVSSDFSGSPDTSNWKQVSYSESTTQQKQNLRALQYPFRIPWQILATIDLMLSTDKGVYTDKQREEVLNKSLSVLVPQYTFIYPNELSSNNPFSQEQQFAATPDIKVNTSEETWFYTPHNQKIQVSDEATVEYSLPSGKVGKYDGWNEDKSITHTLVRERRVEDEHSSSWTVKNSDASMSVSVQKEHPKLYLKQATNSLVDTQFTYDIVSQINTLVSDTGPKSSVTRKEYSYEVKVGEKEVILSDGTKKKESVYETRYYYIETETITRTWNYNSYERVVPNVFNSNEVDVSQNFSTLFEDTLKLGKKNLIEFRDLIAMLPGGTDVARSLKGTVFSSSYIAPLESFNTQYYYDNSFVSLDDWLKPTDVPLQTVYYNQLDPTYANTSFGSSTIKEKGAAPTALAMVLASYQKTYSIPTPPNAPNPVTPAYCAQWATNKGYIKSDKLNKSYFKDLAKLFGVNTTQLSTSSSSLPLVQNALREGYMVIASTSKGIFNNDGYIVLYNLNDDKSISVYDTVNSKLNGAHNFGLVFKDITQFWIFKPFIDSTSMDLSGNISNGNIPSSSSQIGSYMVTGDGSMLMPIMKLNTPGAKFRVSSGYGHRSDPFTSKTVFHRGVDIPGSTSDKLCSTLDGVVTKVVRKYTPNKGGGMYVIIDHGNISTTYMHMSLIRSDLTPGMTVKAGEYIGNMGTTGGSTGVHLHFAVTRGDTHVYPFAYLPAKKQ